MRAGRVRLALAAKHLIFGHPRDFAAVPVPSHECGLICLQPLVFGVTRTAMRGALDGATIYADLDVHAKRLVRVWAQPPMLGDSIELTRYVLA